MSVLELLDSPKLISRKIWITEKSWNFHTVKLWVGNTDSKPHYDDCYNKMCLLKNNDLAPFCCTKSVISDKLAKSI